jgi:hypothetical protein
MFTTKTWLVVLGVMIFLICALAVIGGITQKRAVSAGVEPSAAIMSFVRVCALVLLAGCVACIVPLGVRMFLGGQQTIGNSEAGAVAFVRRYETAVVLGVWIVWGLGFLIALPVMLRDFKADQAAARAPEGAESPGTPVGQSTQGGSNPYVLPGYEDDPRRP